MKKKLNKIKLNKIKLNKIREEIKINKDLMTITGKKEFCSQIHNIYDI